MNFTEVESHIANVKKQTEDISPVYLLNGDDGYLLSKTLKNFSSLLNDEFLEFNYLKVNLSDGFFNVFDGLYSYPVFDNLKIVVLSDANGKLSDQDVKIFENYIQDAPKESVLLCLCDSEFAKQFSKKKGVITIDCAKLNEVDTYAEMDKIIAEKPVSVMDKTAKTKLFKRTLGNISRIAMEIVKLKAYAGEKITDKDIEEMVTPETDYQIYEISNAVSEKNAGKALEVLDNFSKNGIKGVTVINLLYGHYRKMLQVELHKNDTDQRLAELLGVKPFAVYHIRNVSKNYSQIRLKKCVDYLHGLQFGILQGVQSEANASKDAVITLLTL